MAKKKARGTEKKVVRKTAPKRAGRKKESKSKRHYEGPREWLFPMLEETYSRLGPKEEIKAEEAAPPRTPAPARTKAARFRSSYHEGKDESVLAALPRSHWEDKLRQFKRRKVATPAAVRAAATPEIIGPRMPAIPGQNNWTPLGPAIIARGQTQNRAAISGRVSGIAVAPGGTRLYA